MIKLEYNIEALDNKSVDQIIFHKFKNKDSFDNFCQNPKKISWLKKKINAEKYTAISDKNTFEILIKLR